MKGNAARRNIETELSIIFICNNMRYAFIAYNLVIYDAINIT